jgi:hypothetical protein
LEISSFSLYAMVRKAANKVKQENSAIQYFFCHAQLSFWYLNFAHIKIKPRFSHSYENQLGGSFSFTMQNRGGKFSLQGLFCSVILLIYSIPMKNLFSLNKPLM